MSNEIKLKELERKLLVALKMGYPVELKINGEYYTITEYDK